MELIVGSGENDEDIKLKVGSNCTCSKGFKVVIDGPKQGMHMTTASETGQQPATPPSGDAQNPGIQIPSAEKVEIHHDGKVLAVLKSSVKTRSEKPEESTDRKAARAKPKLVKLKNWTNNKISVDSLHSKAVDPKECDSDRCLGSIMCPASTSGLSRSKAELIVQAKDLMDQYYQSIKRTNTPAHKNRIEEVLTEIEARGTYDLTYNELAFGAKTAWRNAPRCVGRIQWTKLQVFDARHITTNRNMFEAICTHIQYATNKGSIRSVITVFPQREDGKPDCRIWNPLLLQYAGYKQADGTVIGNAESVELTQICMKLGWKGKGGMFDVLPLILSANGSYPEYFDIPESLILEVKLSHPNYPSFEELGLKSVALPLVSGMMFDCGGLKFPAAPFGGWFVGSKIGARDLCDPQRYNLLEKFGQIMGLDTKRTSSLWKDKVMVEVNVAVLTSFQKAGVTISDHHAAAESFMRHYASESRLRGGCPADWVWLVPPLSGAATELFHQEMINYILKPSFEEQEEAWKNFKFKDSSNRQRHKKGTRKKVQFKDIARAVKLVSKLMASALSRRVKCYIVYATETGKSQRYAESLCEIFKHAFDAVVMCMDELDVISLQHDGLVLIVTSTFGNGDPPENGVKFAQELFEMQSTGSELGPRLQSTNYEQMSEGNGKENSSSDQQSTGDSKDEVQDILDTVPKPLENLKFSVLGLGSRVFPKFCAFGHYVDNLLEVLGAERLSPMVEADELSGQDQAFKTWAETTFKAACEAMCITNLVTIKEATGSLSNDSQVWTPQKFRLMLVENEEEKPICDGLSKLHKRQILPCKLKARTNLQPAESSRQTIRVELDTGGADELSYFPGDHLGVFPANRKDIVDRILARLENAPPPDKLLTIEMSEEQSSLSGDKHKWVPLEKFPKCTLRTAITHYLDVNSPPAASLIQMLASHVSDANERERMQSLAESLAADPTVFEEWQYDVRPNLAEVLDFYPSLRIPATLLLTQLPLVQQRYYSISSSPRAVPGEIHATLAVVQWPDQKVSGHMHLGLCSNWLNGCHVGETIPCFVRQAKSFHLPEDRGTPLIMVGPGTGIAPFRGFWQDRQEQMRGGQNNGWGNWTLYFGCRQEKIDQLYHEEIATAKSEGVLENSHTAFSRQPGVPKAYVQDLLMKHSADVFKALGQSAGHFYVCGDVSMASDVTAVLEKIFAKCGEISPEAAKKQLLKLRDDGRFHEDIYGNTLRTSEVNAKFRSNEDVSWKHFIYGIIGVRRLSVIAFKDQDPTSSEPDMYKILEQAYKD